MRSLIFTLYAFSLILIIECKAQMSRGIPTSSNMEIIKSNDYQGYPEMEFGQMENMHPRVRRHPRRKGGSSKSKIAYDECFDRCVGNDFNKGDCAEQCGEHVHSLYGSQ